MVCALFSCTSPAGEALLLRGYALTRAGRGARNLGMDIARSPWHVCWSSPHQCLHVAQHVQDPALHVGAHDRLGQTLGAECLQVSWRLRAPHVVRPLPLIRFAAGGL